MLTDVQTRPPWDSLSEKTNDHPHPVFRFLAGKHLYSICTCVISKSVPLKRRCSRSTCTPWAARAAAAGLSAATGGFQLRYSYPCPSPQQKFYRLPTAPISSTESFHEPCWAWAWVRMSQPRYLVVLMYGFYHTLNNLRFRKSQNVNDLSAAPVDIPVASSEIMKCRLSK